MITTPRIEEVESWCADHGWLWIRRMRDENGRGLTALSPRGTMWHFGFGKDNHLHSWAPVALNISGMVEVSKV